MTQLLNGDDERVVPEWELQDRLARTIRMIPVRSNGELAELLGIRRETIGRWLSGQNKPSRAWLFVLADMAGVRMDWLEDGVVRHQGLEPRTRCFVVIERQPGPDLRLVRGGRSAVNLRFTPKLRAVS
jgi:transcriptional regulator with XRE-family HTH domain